MLGWISAQGLLPLGLTAEKRGSMGTWFGHTWPTEANWRCAADAPCPSSLRLADRAVINPWSVECGTQVLNSQAAVAQTSFTLSLAVNLWALARLFWLSLENCRKTPHPFAGTCFRRVHVAFPCFFCRATYRNGQRSNSGFLPPPPPPHHKKIQRSPPPPPTFSFFPPPSKNKTNTFSLEGGVNVTTRRRASAPPRLASPRLLWSFARLDAAPAGLISAAAREVAARDLNAQHLAPGEATRYSRFHWKETTPLVC